MSKLAACALLIAAAGCVALAEGAKFEGHQLDMSKRVGQFGNTHPYVDLYLTYVKAFDLPFIKRDASDLENYRPSEATCEDFLTTFKANGYKLDGVEEFVKLDACLGALYDDPDYEGAERLSNFRDDKQLETLYKNTGVTKLESEEKACIANLLLSSIGTRKQFGNVACNNIWLQVFIQYAECTTSFNKFAELRKSDSYLVYLDDLVKTNVQSCVDHEIGHLNVAVRKSYNGHRRRKALNFVSKNFVALNKQAYEKNWPRPLIELLATVQNTNTEVDPRYIHKLIKGTYESTMVPMPEGSDVLRDQLFANMAEFATNQLLTKKKKPFEFLVRKSERRQIDQDTSGKNRYQRIIDILCNPFRSSDDEANYDYAISIVRLVRLLDFVDLFGVTREAFMEKMLVHAKESGVAYEAVSLCNILTHTKGTIVGLGNDNKSYKVSFNEDVSRMVIWPDMNYF